MTTKFVLDGSKLNTSDRLDKARRIEKDINLVINSDLFKNVFIKKLHQRNYQEGERSDFRFLAPEQIFAHFMSGFETLTPEIDGIIKVVVDDYFTRSNVVGMTYTGKETIYVNTKFFDYSYDIYSGSNILHEASHKMGFHHDYKNTARRKDSLSYLINEIYEECWGELLGIEKVVWYYSRSWRSLFLKKYKRSKSIWTRKEIA